jgi:hypothetical protein
MVTLVKHEWHHTDVQYAFELDEDILAEVYPDMKKRELKKRLKEIEDGSYDIDSFLSDAEDEGVEIDWEHQQDDMWTMRKGGYDVTFEVGDEDSWHTPEEKPEPTHKCTKCKFTGQSYDFDWTWKDANGNDLEEPNKQCPYCESPIELTEVGIAKEKEDAEWRAQWDLESTDDEADELDEEVLSLEQAIEELKNEPDWPFPDEEPVEEKPKAKKKKK